MSELRFTGMSGDAPPPSPELERLIASAEPVTPRRRHTLWLLAVTAAIVYAVAWFLLMHLRTDLQQLPRVTMALAVAIWTGAFLVASWFALVPRKQQVLLDGMRALQVGLFLLALLLLSNAICVVDTDTTNSMSLPRAAHCAHFAIWPWLVMVLVTWRSVRRTALATPWQTGAALGLAGGALSGMLLTFVCETGGVAHQILGHWGGALFGGVVGGLVGGWLLRR